MNVHISYKAHKSPDVEREFNQQIDRLSRRLQVFRPDLVHLYGTVDEASSREGTVVSLNLRLPSGQIAAQSTANNTPIGAVKAGFSDLVTQLTKHKELLRANRNWRGRRRPDGKNDASGVPFETTIAVVHPEKVTRDDVNGYVNANLPRLERYVERELRYLEASGQVRAELVSKEEVIDEVIAEALGDEEEKPELLSLERWLYRLAIQAIRRLADSNIEEQERSIPLERSAEPMNVTGSDELVLEFHQPDDRLQFSGTIADSTVGTPEEIAASDEMVAQVELALRGADRNEREAFVLFALEGFTVDEIARITDRDAKQVRASIDGARGQLEQRLPMENDLKKRLLQYSRIA